MRILDFTHIILRHFPVIETLRKRTQNKRLKCAGPLLPVPIDKTPATGHIMPLNRQRSAR
jgi:hypothetical protein